jgi:hypothetical protein
VRWRGVWPSVRQTEQNEQCFGQPRTVCTDAHMYARRKRVPSTRHELFASMRPPVVTGRGSPAWQFAQRDRPGAFAVAGHHRVGRAEVACLIRVQRCVDAAEDDVGARRRAAVPIS